VIELYKTAAARGIRCVLFLLCDFPVVWASTVLVLGKKYLETGVILESEFCIRLR